MNIRKTKLTCLRQKIYMDFDSRFVCPSFGMW